MLGSLGALGREHLGHQAEWGSAHQGAEVVLKSREGALVKGQEFASRWRKEAGQVARGGVWAGKRGGVPSQVANKWMIGRELGGTGCGGVCGIE